MMKGVLHISICQQLWNEKLPWNIYLKIGHLMWTLVTWVWEFEFGFSNIKQKIWVDERGMTIVDFIVLFVTQAFN
jgi:hypothetical protein